MKAVIFDMDGTLIDSEPMWKTAEKVVFTSVGVDVTESLAAQTATMTTRETTAFWYHHFPWSGKSLDTVENEVVDHVASLIHTEGTALTGVTAILDYFQSKQLKIGLATNAPAKLIDVVLNKLAIRHYFHAVSSSEDEIAGKPHPAVYLSTARKLNVDPSKCIAFEDSYSGVLSANDAKMKTVCIPPHTHFTDEKFALADLRLRSLADFTDHHFGLLSALD